MIIDGYTKIPRIIKLAIPELLKAASGLKTSGKIAISTTNLTYLKIDDDYIHQLLPLLRDKKIKKPDYFSDESIGAHITVIYPEENKIIENTDLNQEHSFIIKDIATAELNSKTYYILLVESPTLLQLRRRFNLTDMLYFRGYAIDFHITIGVGSS